MKAKYDLEPIELTDRFVDALKELMEAECEMMQENEPDDKHCWTWGRCTINDLCHRRGLEFEFGGDEDLPVDGLGDFAVVVAA
jgi:hypothetical protein